jgi:regulator of ribonuclease activity A
MNTPDICDKYSDNVKVIPLVLRNFGALSSFEGPIQTIDCFEDNSKVREELSRPGNGRVLFVDGKGSMNRALLGDNLAQMAVDNDWVGIIINGCIRDVNELAIMNIGIKALGSHPMKTAKKGAGHVGVELSVGGVTVLPGHYLVADDNGVVILPEKV